MQNARVRVDDPCHFPPADPWPTAPVEGTPTHAPWVPGILGPAAFASAESATESATEAVPGTLVPVHDADRRHQRLVVALLGIIAVLIAMVGAVLVVRPINASHA